MDYEDYSPDDSVRSILSELSSLQNYSAETQNVNEKNEINLTSAELEDFILKSGAKTVSTTQSIIQSLLEQIQITPDAELITSVAEMVSSNNKALETLTKIHLNNEKLKQAKELEQFKQATKLEIANNNNQQNKSQMTREDIMKVLYETDDSIRSIRQSDPTVYDVEDS
jgi:hypothetical protein